MSDPAPGSTSGSSSPGLPGPLSYLQSVAAAGRLFKARFFSLAGTFAVVFALGSLLVAGLDVIGAIPANITFVVYEVTIGLGGAFAVAYSSVRLADAASGVRTDVADARAIVRVHAKEIATGGLLSSVVILFLTLMGLGPIAIVLMLGPPLVAQAIVLEYRPFREALSRVRELSSGGWARVMLVLLGTAFAVVIVQLLLWILVTQPFVNASDDVIQVVVTLFGYAARVVSASFLAAVGFVVYLDLRARAEELTREGFEEERREATGDQRLEGSNQD